MDKKCYCCKTLGSSMDAALNELGMLSTVTNIRKQYLEEQASKTNRSTEICDSLAKSQSVPNSPARGYRVITMNPLFVTGLGAASGASPKKLSYAVEKEIKITSLGTDYAQETMSSTTAQCSKIGRIKLARIKRFRTPYEVPWRINAQIEECKGPNSWETKSPSKLHVRTTSAQNGAVPSDCPRHRNGVNGLQRSKSMDDLDMSKLKIGEHLLSHTVQNKEVDNVSQHLKQMKVVE